MRVQSNGKVRRTSSEWDSIFAEFEASGLSAAAFCRRKKLAKSTFTKRRLGRGRRRAVRRSTAARFVELTPEPARPLSLASATRDPGSFEIVLPGGVILRWKA